MNTNNRNIQAQGIAGVMIGILIGALLGQTTDPACIILVQAILLIVLIRVENKEGVKSK